MSIYDLMGYTTIATWALGAILVVLGLLLAVLRLGWFTVKEIYGWPKLYKILREHHDRQRKEQSQD